MKKKLEAELISIAHRILKLKNRAELDQLQAETLKLYEKLTVLKFVEDNFNEVKPTIGFASAEEKLEEVYGLDAIADEESDAPKTEVEAPVEAEKKKEEAAEEPEVAAAASAEVKEEVKAEEAKPEIPAKEETPPTEEVKEEPVADTEAEKEKEVLVVAMETEKTEAELRSEEESAKVVFKYEQDTNLQEEAAAMDAEVKTIAPQADVATEAPVANVEFAFERAAAPEEPKVQKEISFEDFHDYKEPEFVKKDTDAPTAKVEVNDWQNWEPAKAAEPEKPKEEPEAKDWRDWEPAKTTEAEKSKEEPKAEPAPVKDWRDWEPAKTAEPEKPAAEEEPKAEPVAEPAARDWRDWEPAKEPEKPKAEEPKVKTLNDALGKTINLGLNDRIAFEKNLFGGSGEDLNRVLSQLNTLNTFGEAKDFIKDLVKPDYSNWQGKEEYEGRFMEIVEKRFN